MDDSKIILTLDAGGTNFVFSAMQNFKEIVEPITLPSEAHNLDSCISNLKQGFRTILSHLDTNADAISFAFPGPANYALGIIENLPNFEAFNGSVPLGPILANEFNIPVFINNDGDLFAYGEALAGFLLFVNTKLRESNSPKRFKSLVGLTIGTGFGAGVVIDGMLLNGDNSCAAGIHDTLNGINSSWNAEESVSTRAVQREYAQASNQEIDKLLMPGDIYDIAKGIRDGDKSAANYAFETLGEGLGHSIANISTLIDGLVVIGGGLSKAWDLFAPTMFSTLKKKYVTAQGVQNNRLSVSVYNLEDEMDDFMKGNPVEVSIPGTSKTIVYDRSPRIGVGISKLGASKAVSLGAYSFALQQLGD